jgi:hypothetical protein
MYHPTVLACMLRVAEAARTSALCDTRHAASDSGFMEQLAMSRDAIGCSRLLLKKLREREGE